MHRVRSSLWTAAATLIVVVAGCDDESPNVSGLDPVTIARIEVTPSLDTVFVADTIFPSDTLKFQATVFFKSGTSRQDVDFVWETTDSSVATVDQDGTVFPTGIGTTRVLASAGDQGSATLVVAPRPKQRIVLGLSLDTLFIDDPITPGDTTRLSATVLDDQNRPVPGVEFTWSSDNPSAATVDQSGLVQAIGLGSATITVTAGELSASTVIAVERFVGSVAIGDTPTQVLIGDTIQLAATAASHLGVPLEGRTFTWTSSDPTVATVDANGQVMVLAPGEAIITATTGFQSAQLTITALQRRITALDAGQDFTCGRITLNRSFCWGIDSSSQLGAVRRDTSCIDPFGATRVDTTTGETRIDFPCSLLPLRVQGGGQRGREFKQITAGGGHACGLADDGTAYCWGSNGSGQLGNGTLTIPPEPTLVTSALRFDSLAAGGSHTCGLVAGGAAYCWGSDAAGQLGSEKFAASTTPIPVDGSQRFSQIVAGLDHTCGIAAPPSRRVFCWGANGLGQLGIGSTDSSAVPLQIPDSRAFVALSAGDRTTCGIATDGQAFCWGRGTDGQLGNGVGSDAHTPQQVTGGAPPWRAIAVGGTHVCALGNDSNVYCWGTYDLGALRPTNIVNIGLTPTPITSNVQFVSVTSHKRHSCAVATNGTARCWGSNIHGPFGDGLQALIRRDATQQVTTPQ
jgi:alpha-tubulin suppressor-like RCC1 family protein